MSEKVSSYSKVNQHFMELPAWRELVSRTREGLSRPPSVGVRFEYGDVRDSAGSLHQGGRAVFYAVLDVPYDDTKSVTVTSVGRSSRLSAAVDSYELVSTGTLMKIFNAHFGVRRDPRFKRVWVPTYNCKADKAQDSFVKHARQALWDETASQREASARAVFEAWQAIPQRDVDDGIEKAYHEQAVTEIRDQLLKWYAKVPESILRRGVEEAHVQFVLES